MICRLQWSRRSHRRVYDKTLIRGMDIAANGSFSGSHCCGLWSLRGGRVSGFYESALGLKKPKVCFILYSVAVVIIVLVLVISEI